MSIRLMAVSRDGRTGPDGFVGSEGCEVSSVVSLGDPGCVDAAEFGWTLLWPLFAPLLPPPPSLSLLLPLPLRRPGWKFASFL